MANRVHSKFAENERTLAGQILETQKIAFKIGLVVQVDVEAKEIDILRQQILRRRISRVGKENIGVLRASDADEMFDKLGHASHAKPARHRARDLVADQITEHRWVADVSAHGASRHSRDRVADFFLP